MTVQEVLVTLERWRAAGWLRDLDVALARFVAETDARAPASLVLAIALVAHMEGRGHTGLMLPALATGTTVADRHAHANVGPGDALGWQITGSWWWNDGYFCREMDWEGYAIPYNCQLVETNDGRIVRFTVDRGTGDSAQFRLR